MGVACGGGTEVQLAFGLTVRIPYLNVHVKEITYEAGSIKATYSVEYTCCLLSTVS